MAIGKRLGINQNIMIQYVNGTLKPTKEQERLILNEVSAVGKELVGVEL